MICLFTLVVAAVVLVPMLKTAGFFGSTTTVAPDIELSRKQGALGVILNGPPPTLTADVDSTYGGRASTSAPNATLAPGQSLLDYFSSQVKTASNVWARNLDQGGFGSGPIINPGVPKPPLRLGVL